MLVPFIAAWGQTDGKNKCQQKFPISPGMIQPQMGTVLDLLPTLCNLAEAPIPQELTLDGYDLKPQVAGKKNTERKEDFLNHFPHEHRSSYFTSYVNKDWKVIYHYPLPSRGGKQKNAALTPRYELYNLQRDPYEKEDLSSSEPEKLQSMMASLINDLEQKQALYPQQNKQPIKPVH